MSWFSVIKSTIQILIYLRKINKFDYDALYSDFKFNSDEKLYKYNKNIFNKGRQYLKSFGLLGLCFGKEIGRPISNDEFIRIIYLSNLAPIYDDLFDVQSISEHKIIKMIVDPNNTKPENSKEVLFLSFYRKLYFDLKDKETFIDYFIKLTKAQNNSKKQASQKSLSLAEVEQVTADKGGYSCLLLRSLLDEPIVNEQPYYQLGKTSQYMDDIFDWFDDCLENRKTFANCYSLNEIEKKYKETLFKTIKSFNSTAFNKMIKVLLSPALVCINYYKKIDLNTKKTNVNTLDRNTFICDMEKLQNVYQLLFISKK